jgi:hypothetical protein
MMVRFKLSSLLAGSALAASILVAGAAPAAAAERTTCSGGSIAGGTYESLTVTGSCVIDSGDVRVRHDVTVTSTGTLDGMHAGSTLTVRHDLVVRQGGSALLGCNSDDGCGGTVSDRIMGKVRSTGAMFLVLHNDTIRGNVSVSGGSAAYDCSAFAFTDFAFDRIGGNVRITGLRTCWDGLAHNSIDGNVNFDNNVTLIVEPPPVGADGNELGDNNIEGNLSCFGNSPTPHLSDAVPAPNRVDGKTRGQCVGEV